MPKPVRMVVLPWSARGRPGHADARAEIRGVGAVVRRALGTEAAAAEDIDHRRAVQDLVRHGVKLVAQSQVQSKLRVHFEIVLEIAHGERAPVADYALALELSGRSSGIVDEIGRRSIADRLGGERVAGVIQPDAADFNAGLEGVTAADHGQVIDVVERGADFGVERGAADARRRPTTLSDTGDVP